MRSGKRTVARWACCKHLHHVERKVRTFESQHHLRLEASPGVAIVHDLPTSALVPEPEHMTSKSS